jgi:hypothetical protein
MIDLLVTISNPFVEIGKFKSFADISRRLFDKVNVRLQAYRYTYMLAVLETRVSSTGFSLDVNLLGFGVMLHIHNLGSE